MKNSEKYTTAEERAKAFNKWCDKNRNLPRCNERACIDCTMCWLDLEAEEEKPLPCPVCGSPCCVHDNAVECESGECAYVCWQKGFRADQNVAAHNRVARAVMESGKKEVE